MTAKFSVFQKLMSLETKFSDHAKKEYLIKFNDFKERLTKLSEPLQKMFRRKISLLDKFLMPAKMSLKNWLDKNIKSGHSVNRNKKLKKILEMIPKHNKKTSSLRLPLINVSTF